ncbi:hypothetical protein BP5796_12687 [Coleophoma crateriformis]|uniref:Uncharacterized protein n=1 Tax=Coleophoma crateriformis TaxID=565419 RepID=A0A3D8Q6C6_9HELO|nr:hypothetical protein BP5796_12687 [Coleophoma crateriformis]
MASSSFCANQPLACHCHQEPAEPPVERELTTRRLTTFHKMPELPLEMHVPHPIPTIRHRIWHFAYNDLAPMTITIFSMQLGQQKYFHITSCLQHPLRTARFLPALLKTTHEARNYGLDNVFNTTCSFTLHDAHPHGAAHSLAGVPLLCPSRGVELSAHGHQSRDGGPVRGPHGDIPAHWNCGSGAGWRAGGGDGSCALGGDGGVAVERGDDGESVVWGGVGGGCFGGAGSEGSGLSRGVEGAGGGEGG